MSSPRTITWWTITDLAVPVFKRTDPLAPVVIMSKNGPQVHDRELADLVSLPRVFIETELRAGSVPHVALVENIERRLVAMVEAGGDTAEWESAAFYGILIANDQIGSTDTGVIYDSVLIGVAYSVGPLEPVIAGIAPGIITLLSTYDCINMGLPIWEGGDPLVKAYGGPRPTRFERAWVI
jgi:hypothetical protein